MVFPEAVADAANRFQEIAGLAQLAAQGFDVYVDGALEDDRAFADGGIHELGPAEGTPRLTQHALQQAKLRRRQLDVLAVHARLVADPVDLDAGMLDDVAPRDALPRAA